MRHGPLLIPLTVSFKYVVYHYLSKQTDVLTCEPIININVKCMFTVRHDI